MIAGSIGDPGMLDLTTSNDQVSRFQHRGRSQKSVGEGGSTMELASHGAHPVLFPSSALNLTARGAGIRMQADARRLQLCLCHPSHI